MQKRHSIEVRQVAHGCLYNSNADYISLGTIKRVLRAEQFGNFNPLFCTYKGDKRTLVHSEQGDLSDPFRRDGSYAATLFIRVN